MSPYFDFTQAEAETYVSPGRTITEADVVSFASLTGDWHPQHADAAWAASSPFGERVAHGALVLSYALGLLDFDPAEVAMLRGFRRVTFKRPVLIGDTIHAEVRLRGTTPIDECHVVVAAQMKIVNQHGRPVAVAVAEIVWRATRSAAVSTTGAR